MGVAPRQLFLSAVEPVTRERWAANAGLAEALETATQLARASTSINFSADASVMATVLARAVGDDPTRAAQPEPFADLALADLYLAEACAAGERDALRRFDTLHGPELDRAIGRSPGLGLNAAEFRQLVAVRLFVSRDATLAPKILSYRGKGSLKAWVRVLAARLIIDLSRQRRTPESEPEPESSEAVLLARMDDGSDMELEYLRETYGPLLKQAFASGIAALSVRQRNLLRQRYFHEVSGDALAKLYGVHRSTVFVWLEQARVALLQRAGEGLADAVPADRLESVIQMLGSQLQLSVRRVLESRLETEPRQGH